jgi:N-lysine methyltransferase SETD6
MAYSFHDELTPKPSSKADVDEKKETEDDDEEDEEEEEGIIAMVPMADMLNHRTGFNNARLFHEPEALQMRAIKDIRASEQIYNTYGDLCNADLLRKYGFVDEPNDFDIVEISGDLVRDVSCPADMTDEEKDAKVSIKIYTMLL